jgi:hypothetical protein
MIFALHENLADVEYFVNDTVYAVSFFKLVKHDIRNKQLQWSNGYSNVIQSSRTVELYVTQLDTRTYF